MMLATDNKPRAGHAGTEVVRALIERRKALHLRQRDVAELMHVGQSAVCQIERGNDPRWSTLMRYAEALGVAISVDLLETDT
jgi:transcriptional regulator with XRE-family HTH domain